MKLSVLMITKNAETLLEKSLSSVRSLADEIIVIDDCSVDRTVEIAERFHANVFKHRQETFGQQRSYGISKCSNSWILMIDADEIVTAQAAEEIKIVLAKSAPYGGYRIPFLNHFMGHALHHGGEAYHKLILFQKGKTKIVSDHIHEHAQVEGPVGELNSKILHYSYQSLGKTYSKFASYARKEAVRKRHHGEKADLLKLMSYPIHMFYARYIKDKGYKDHPSRILLDAGFAYMEFLTYFYLLASQKEHKKTEHI